MYRSTKAADTAELTELIYGAAFGDCGWQDFLDRLTTTMPNGRSALHYHDLSSPTTYVPYVSGFAAEDIDQFNNHFAAINPWIPKSVLVPVGHGLAGEHIVARKDLVKSEFYNDWLKRQTGCETTVGVTIVRSATRTLLVSTCTSSTDEELNQHAADQYTQLAPHLRRAFDFLRRRDLTTVEQHEGPTLLDTIGVGLVYVGDNLRIRSMNECAQRMTANGSPFRIGVNGRLFMDEPGTNATLQLLALPPGSPTQPQVRIVRTAEDSAFRITLVRRSSSIFTELLDGPTVAVLIEPATSVVGEQHLNHLKASYGLTPAEIRIASGIAAGLTLKEMSSANGVSYETIRTQLKSIYSKTRVNSQAGLVKLLLR
ncbi:MULTISPECIES: helix-turn-helix transcriptional regulator [unclassified Ensifer]|uniref:helix-turn-helix transcriptional regulator n=1 Tax=unclassified Ensifer TaxID=2633371 RepID=UPI0008131CF8|nr:MULTISPECIES: helix-turn-helix transcriptional regulator [unclassified Ensifer]OCP16876.1 helix-turn-helix transcriptional regulator [Ensifer sp. LC384]OCP24038.1 helix-turn-helix transcriptional regulator [Ensifer sp. LC54]